MTVNIINYPRRIYVENIHKYFVLSLKRYINQLFIAGIEKALRHQIYLELSSTGTVFRANSVHINHVVTCKVFVNITNMHSIYFV